MGKTEQPIIKKVKKVSGEGHHGGAWKVAYADFVTAMMAFFLLMWLLNATTEDQRKGIADYFNPTIPISQISGGGSDILNGSSVLADKTLAKDGTGGARASHTSQNEDKGKELKEKTTRNDAETELENDARFAFGELENDLRDEFDAMRDPGLAEHIQIRVTPEGLVIELVDLNGSPLFNVGSTKASPTLAVLLKIVASNLSMVENDLSIVGHTDSLAFQGAGDYSNWELSTDRAHIARKLMVAAGLPQDRINEVAGKADMEPIVDDPFAPQNRRISITVLKS